MSDFLARKNINLNPKTYFVKAMGAMTLGLFASLLVGLILKTLGEQLSVSFLIECGNVAQKMRGPAIGVAVAYGLQAPALVLFASCAVGMAGDTSGGPAGAFLAVVIGVECGKIVSGETKADILVTPSVTLLVGFAIAQLVGSPVNWLMTSLGELVMWSTTNHPLVMGIIVSVIMGMVLTLPISSAALAIMMGLSGLAAGAATAGCSAQMIGFAIMSFRENGVNGLISQGLGTSMLQMPNIIKNPRIWIPPTLASAITGPLSTVIFGMENIPEGAGMGTSGLVGQIGTVTVMGATLPVFLSILLLHIVLPAVLTLLFYAILSKWGWIRRGDLTLELQSTGRHR